MASTPRPSRFKGLKPTVGRPNGDETVSTDQRSRRREALNHLLYRMMADEPDRYDAFMREHGLLLDQQDRNDAVLVAEQSTDEWSARWVLAEQDGVLVPRSLQLEPTSPATPEGGVTTNLLRELSPSGAVSSAANHRFQGVEGVIEQWTFQERQDHGPTAGTKRSTRGRPQVPNHELADVAVAYLDEVNKGPGVTRRVATRLDMVEDTVRDRIRMARARDFLTPTKRGRRGGGPGPALQAFLNDESGDN